MRSHSFFLLIYWLLLVPAVSAVAVGLPAGTQIQLVANASFTDTQEQQVDSDPASVTLNVMQVAGVSVQTTGQPGQATPGQDFYIPIDITNTGNAPDIFSLTISSANGWPVDIIYDDNGDGIHEPNEQWIITTAGPMVADGYSPCFAKVSVPVNATSGDTLTVTAVSNFDIQVSGQAQIGVDLQAPPSVAITTPTNNPTYNTTNSSLNLSGTASGGLAITKVEWATDQSTSGTCVGTSAWTANSIGLQPGRNVITVTATDSAGRTATASLTVVYDDSTPPSVTITAPVTGSNVHDHKRPAQNGRHCFRQRGSDGCLLV